MKTKAVAMLALIALTLPTAMALTEEEAVEATIEKYFAAAEQEDMQAYLDVMVITGSREEAEEFVEIIWGLFDTRGTMLSNFETEITEDGLEASSVFDLESTLVDAETGDEYPIGNPYIAILQKIEGEWKIELSMPLDDFVESMKDAFMIADTASNLAEEEYQQQKATGGGGNGGNGDNGDIVEMDFGGIILLFIVFAVCGAAFFAWNKFKGKKG